MQGLQCSFSRLHDSKSNQGPHNADADAFLQIVLLGDDSGSLHLYSLESEKLLATKQVASSRITAIISCPATADVNSGNGSSSGGGSAGGSNGSQGGSCTQFAVLSENGVGLWQLRQGFSHGIIPGGHRQVVIALQLAHTPTQVRLWSCHA